MQHYTLVSSPADSGLKVAVLPGLTLAQSLFLAGAFNGLPLCSGLGRCGLCRARFVRNAPDPLPEELARLAPELLARGWRLTCLRPPVPDAWIEIPPEADRQGEPPADDAPAARPARAPGENDAFPAGAKEPGAAGAVLGIDLGTTSIQWRLKRGETVLAQGGRRNPQMGAGSDVMARLALAALPGGAKRLQDVCVAALSQVLSGLPEPPAAVCLAGNSVMTLLTLGLDASGLARAPYRLAWKGGAFVPLYRGGAPVYVPPLLAPFVGADISAGLAALRFGPEPPRAPFLLADLGTNGEFALVLADATVLVASVPMGPALEGVGMRQGMLAGPGAAVAFSLGPGGLAPRLFGQASGAARGVAAAGYLSLLAALRQAGVLDVDGRFARLAATPLAGRILAGLSAGDGQPRLSAGGVTLWAEDVESLLKVKAAFNAAVATLLEHAGLTFSGLAEVRLAGALGEHIRIGDLETLGFLPPGAAASTRSCGNTSLAGACLAAARPDVRDWLAALPAASRIVDLVDAPGFQKRYLSAMRFEHA